MDASLDHNEASAPTPVKQQAAEPVLIISHSARALAQAASRAGHRCIAIDWFADTDTIACCSAYQRVDATAKGFDSAQLQRVMTRFDPHKTCTVVIGSGFEQSGATALDCGGRRICANSPEVVAKTKNPWQLARALTSLTIPHPEIASKAPANRTDWLYKLAGGCGGVHIFDGTDLPVRIPPASGLRYWQRRVRGKVYSATVVSTNQQCQIIGFCAQWVNGQRPKFYRYAGAIRIHTEALPPNIHRQIATAIEQLWETFGLRGLWGVDFVVAKDRWWLLEINPRPSMSFELFDSPQRLFEAHLRAFTDQPIPPQVLQVTQSSASYSAHFIVYPKHPVISGRDWPPWSADRPAPETNVDVGTPFCTVYAAGDSRRATIALLAQRRREILRNCAIPAYPDTKKRVE